MRYPILFHLNKFVHRYTKTSLCKLVKTVYFVSCSRFATRQSLQRKGTCALTFILGCLYDFIAIIEPDFTRLAQLVSGSDQGVASGGGAQRVDSRLSLGCY